MNLLSRTMERPHKKLHTDTNDAGATAAEADSDDRDTLLGSHSQLDLIEYAQGANVRLVEDLNSKAPLPDKIQVCGACALFCWSLTLSR